MLDAPSVENVLINYKANTKVGLEPPNFKALLEKATHLAVDIEGLLAGFPKKMVAAKATQPAKGWVLQAHFRNLLEVIDDKLVELGRVSQALDSSLGDPVVARLALQAQKEIQVPRKATVEHAISKLDFVNTDLVYDAEHLENWYADLKTWAVSLQGDLRKLQRTATKAV
jgi:hypothetical protein